MPSLASSGDYARDVKIEYTIEQRGDDVRIKKNSKTFRSICYAVETTESANKISPVDFAQAVLDTEFPALLTAIAKEESTFVLRAKHKRSGAWGLFQVRQCVWGELTTPDSAAEQAKQAERVLKYYLNESRGRIVPALEGWLGGARKGSTYVARVLKTYRSLKGVKDVHVNKATYAG